MPEERDNERIANVKTLAARLARFGEGFSIREYLDALALAGGSLVKVAYRGEGVDVAIKQFTSAFERAVRKNNA